jgi:hypothetical protein
VLLTQELQTNVLIAQRWDNNIKMDVKEDGGVDWSNLAHDRDKRQAFVNTVMNIWAP